MEWYKYYLLIAEQVAVKSKDRSVKFGAVIVGPDNEIRSTGFNGFPRGIDDNIKSRHKRPEKYCWTEHAERNAIYNAARCGIATKGCSIVVNGPPCNDCARAIIQAGITKVYYCNPPNTGPGSMLHDDKLFERTMEMLKEAGVVVFHIITKEEK